MPDNLPSPSQEYIIISCDSKTIIGRWEGEEKSWKSAIFLNLFLGNRIFKYQYDNKQFNFRVRGKIYDPGMQEHLAHSVIFFFNSRVEGLNVKWFIFLFGI